jgi:5'-methylthioadenosine phosphorylase
MVVAVLHANADLSQRIIRALVPLIGAGFDSPAHQALATAIVTDRAAISPAAKTRLQLIAGRYLD